MNKPLIVLGAGGHAAVLVDILQSQGRKILALCATDYHAGREVFLGLKILSDKEVLGLNPLEVLLVNGIGSLPSNNLRQKIYDMYVQEGFFFETVIADSAIVSKFVDLGQGVQLLPSVTIQAGVKIGENTIINSGAIVEHDCVLGSNNHLAPNATLSGSVKTSKNVHIGTGASVIQSIEIGENSVIGAGAVVTKNISSNVIVYPARSIEKIMDI